MTRLALGVLLWSMVHFIPVIATDLKKNLLDRFGEYPFKGIFSVFMLISIYLIITGWKSAVPEVIYTPPAWGHYATGLLVLVGFVLFLAPYPPNNIKRALRHPQLIAMVCWGVGHLLANGELRSIIFFGGLTAWAVIETFLLNRRDGEWTKPEAVSSKKDLAVVVFSVLVFMTVLYTHALLFGSAVLP